MDAYFTGTRTVRGRLQEFDAEVGPGPNRPLPRVLRTTPVPAAPPIAAPLAAPSPPPTMPPMTAPPAAGIPILAASCFFVAAPCARRRSCESGAVRRDRPARWSRIGSPRARVPSRGPSGWLRSRFREAAAGRQRLDAVNHDGAGDGRDRILDRARVRCYR